VHNTGIMHLWLYSSGCRYLRWSAPVMPTWNLVPPTCR